MTEKHLIDRKALTNETYKDQSQRPKVHEDDLLRKIQAEELRSHLIDEAISTDKDKDVNREHYENALLDRVMQSLMGEEIGQTPKKEATEMLMITSAVALTQDEKEAIVRGFMRKTNKGLRRVTTVVDPSLITGVRLQSESFYYEVSGQKTLRDLKRHLDSSWHL